MVKSILIFFLIFGEIHHKNTEVNTIRFSQMMICCAESYFMMVICLVSGYPLSTPCSRIYIYIYIYSTVFCDTTYRNISQLSPTYFWDTTYIS